MIALSLRSLKKKKNKIKYIRANYGHYMPQAKAGPTLPTPCTKLLHVLKCTNGATPENPLGSLDQRTRIFVSEADSGIVEKIASYHHVQVIWLMRT